jgi:transporter family-2 protein
MPDLVAAIIAVVGGAALALQVAINAALSRAIGHPMAAALVSVIVSAIFLLAALTVLRIPLPSRAALAGTPWWALVGGVLGALYLVLSIAAVPRLGAAVVVALVIAGQLLTSLALDHVGAFGLAAHSITLWRFAGAGALIVGVVLIHFF